MAQGHGLAVPAATAEWVLHEVLSHGQVRRRQLGITAMVVPLSRQLIRELDLLGSTGVQVMSVIPQSAAADLAAGDVIVSLGDRVVETLDDLHRLLTVIPRDQPVVLQVVRDESLASVSVPAV